MICCFTTSVFTWTDLVWISDFHSHLFLTSKMQLSLLVGPSFCPSGPCYVLAVLEEVAGLAAVIRIGSQKSPGWKGALEKPGPTFCCMWGLLLSYLGLCQEQCWICEGRFHHFFGQPALMFNFSHAEGPPEATWACCTLFFHHASVWKE